MQIGQTRRLAVLGLLCAVLGLTGCGGSSKPKQKFTPTSTFSDPRGTGSPAPSTPSVATTGPNVRPGEKPPTLPDGAKLNNPSGGAQFAGYWIEALDWGYATTDSSLARTLYAPSCSGCARFLQNIIDVTRQQNQSFRGGLNVVETNVVTDDTRHPGTQPVDVTIHADALQTLDAAGHLVITAAAIPKTTFRVWLKWASAGWVLVDSKEVVFK
jgi:hypothetical protein